MIISNSEYICDICRHKGHGDSPCRQSPDVQCPCQEICTIPSIAELLKKYDLTTLHGLEHTIVMRWGHTLRELDKKADVLIMQELRKRLDLDPLTPAREVFEALGGFFPRFRPGQRVQSLLEGWETTVRLQGDRRMYVALNILADEETDKPVCYWPESDLVPVLKDLES